MTEHCKSRRFFLLLRPPPTRSPPQSKKTRLRRGTGSGAQFLGRNRNSDDEDRKHALCATGRQGRSFSAKEKARENSSGALNRSSRREEEEAIVVVDRRSPELSLSVRRLFLPQVRQKLGSSDPMRRDLHFLREKEEKTRTQRGQQARRDEDDDDSTREAEGKSTIDGGGGDGSVRSNAAAPPRGSSADLSASCSRKVIAARGHLHATQTKKDVPAPLPGSKELDHLLGLELEQLLEVDAAVGEAPERAALGAVVGGGRCGGVSHRVSDGEVQINERKKRTSKRALEWGKLDCERELKLRDSARFFFFFFFFFVFSFFVDTLHSSPSHPLSLSFILSRSLSPDRIRSGQKNTKQIKNTPNLLAFEKKKKEERLRQRKKKKAKRKIKASPFFLSSLFSLSLTLFPLSHHRHHPPNQTKKNKEGKTKHTHAHAVLS